MADAGHQHGHQSEQEESVKPGGKIDELVVVDFGEQEHGRQAAADVKELLFVEVAVGVLGVEGGGIDLQDGDGAEQEHHQQEAPVEVAKAHETAHQWRSLRQRTGTAESSEAKSADCMGRALAGWLGVTKKCPVCSTSACPAVLLPAPGAGVVQIVPTSTGLLGWLARWRLRSWRRILFT